MHQLLHFVREPFTSALQLSALVLGLFNGIFLLKFYIRDRPKLKAAPVHPEVYQWWFRMPDGNFQDQRTRRYGFLAYVSVANKGLRKVQLDDWCLWVRTGLLKRSGLQPLNMPEPEIKLGDQVKFYPVLGQSGLHFDGETLVEPGCSIAGMAFYKYECYGAEVWDPRIHDGRIATTFIAKPVFGRKCRCNISFVEKTLAEINAVAPGIHLIFEDGNDSDL
jgi:hypothetical protein